MTASWGNVGIRLFSQLRNVLYQGYIQEGRSGLPLYILIGDIDIIVYTLYALLPTQYSTLYRHSQPTHAGRRIDNTCKNGPLDRGLFREQVEFKRACIYVTMINEIQMSDAQSYLNQKSKSSWRRNVALAFL